MTVDPFDYAESQADADELIEEFGRTVSLRRMTKSGTEWEPTLTPTDYATKAVKVDFSWRQLQDSTVLATDQRWLVAAGPLAALGVTTILPGDRLVISGTVLEIVPRANAVAPATVTVVFDIQARA